MIVYTSADSVLQIAAHEEIIPIDELYKYCENNSFSSSALHFGSLTYQVWGRNNDFKAVHPDRRYVMQVKWGGILNDLNKIKESRNYE